MFIITNRVIFDKSDLDAFGKEPNPAGPNELRFVQVNSNFQVTVLADEKLSAPEVDALSIKYKLDLDRSKSWYPSLRVACELFDQATANDKHILLFVHGYNNDIKDVLQTAQALERLYNVIAVPFSWPANGGGKVSGTAAYLSDKDDARSSATALHRAVQKVGFYHKLFTESLQQRLLEQARAKHPDNHQRANALFTHLVDKECKTTLNLMCHSMGNYVLKYATTPSNSSLRDLVFDNISLVAADANNPGHDRWVERLRARNRVYVVINENDHALKWSRRKPGDEQEERLGHHLRNLVSSNAYYIDVTRSRGVRTEHSYFKGATVRDNSTLKRLFARIFEGGKAETTLDYHADINVYRS